MKVLKILLKAVVAIVAIVVVALLLLPVWFGPVVKTAANAAVPGIVKSGFHMGHLHLNPYTARFELGDMQLANPEGYPEKYAVTLGDIIFDAETFSLMTDVIHIEEITVKDVFVSVVSGGENQVLNFKQIQYNVAGGKEKYEAAEIEKQKVADAEAEELRLAELQGQKIAEEEAAEEPKETKVIIDKLHISGLRVQLGFLPISIPATVELSDIGRKSGGATLMEAWQQIWAGILKAAGITGDQLKAIGDLTSDAAKQATEALSGAAGQATEALSGAAGQATESVNKATSAMADSAATATEAVGDTFNKATEGATKALDSIKSLW